MLPGDGFPYCRMFNPGKDAVFLTDFYDDGTLTFDTVPGATLSPDAKRTYSAIEFFFDGNWDKFFLQGSYTYAKSKGNTEGGVKSDIGQNNTSVTQDFDYIELTTDTYGYLPNDRRHSLKLFGNYSITDEWSVGVNLLVQSGRPLNCLGVLCPWPRPASIHTALVLPLRHDCSRWDRAGGDRAARYRGSSALDLVGRPEPGVLAALGRWAHCEDGRLQPVQSAGSPRRGRSCGRCGHGRAVAHVSGAARLPGTALLPVLGPVQVLDDRVDVLIDGRRKAAVFYG